MIDIRKSAERGHADHGWLDTRFSFSFANYFDPQHVHFRTLRVMNDDRVAGGGGFPMHPHADMEIVTYVLEGALQHKDSMGNGSVIRPGDVQRMSAGTGISHSEHNAWQNEPVHFLQIWIIPDEMGLVPGYEQKAFALHKHQGTGTLVASIDGRDGSITVHQNVDVWAARLSPEEQAVFRSKPNRRAWIQMARGAGMLNGTLLRAGDGAAASQEELLEIKAVDDAEFLMFDLA
jgi:redox-sensitive bicupin YhaK (pirin superfamily)